MKKYTVSAAAVAALSVMLFSPVQAGATVIDDFSKNSTHTVTITGVGGPTSNTQSGIPVANTIGGTRELNLEVLSSLFGGDSRLRANIPFLVANFNNDSGNSSVGKLIYDANGAGLGGVDITDSGNSQYFQALILASDLNAGFAVSVTDTVGAGGDTATFSTNLGAGPSNVFELFSNFVNATNVNFTQVDKIVITLTGPDAQDTTIQLLTTTGNPNAVPEPSTILLVGIGGLALAAARRRMSK